MNGLNHNWQHIQYVKKEPSYSVLYLLADVDICDIGFVKVIWHSKTSPANNTGPRAIDATTSIIWEKQKGYMQATYLIMIFFKYILEQA